MNFYDRYFLPYLIDRACGMHSVARQRGKLIPLARGRVLEIGIGTGLNLAFYDRSRLESLHALDPSTQMHRLARKRAALAGIHVDVLPLSAEAIPMPDASFDTVVTTFTLCTIPDPLAALAEVRRVLKPGGQLLYCEHGLAPDAKVRRWQHRLTPAWKHIAGGCHLDRDIPALLAQAGFADAHPQTMYLPGPRTLTYNFWGSAEVGGKR
ncbi:MAG: class I SAM-dependent methyltransferase [Nevskiaceae bacterium]|nr:MAG: class I SAM-dependent methyltransferase [Nevskiaceae bacterium]TBR75126.1 MAG: class I SAM-dependent methyltransferase [Nevskiaceae bacterium]